MHLQSNKTYKNINNQNKLKEKQKNINKKHEHKYILTMEGKPSLNIEGNPLLIRNTFKEIPYNRNNSLTIEGNVLRIKNT